MRRLAFALVFTVSSLGIAACSNGASTATSSGAPASCGDVCNHVASLCGATPPSCTAACSTWTDDQRTCIRGATSCAQGDACGSSSKGPSQSPAGSDASSAPPQSPASRTCSAPGEACAGVKDCRSYDCYCSAGLSASGTGCGGTCSDPVESCKTKCKNLGDAYVRVEPGDCPK